MASLWTRRSGEQATATSVLPMETKGSGSNGTQFLDGWLDDVRIYNRVLSDAEITALAQGQ
jgi:hypothetical protein